MMNKMLRLVLIGILPLPLGVLFNWLYVEFFFPRPVSLLISVLFLLAWGCIAFWLSSPGQNAVLQALCMCAFGLLVLALLLYQELVMGEYWGGLIGLGTQAFFLPWLSLAFVVLSPLVHHVWPLYLAIWAALFLTSWLGCFLRQRRCR